jgi:serine/threonine protein kinase
MKYCSACHKTYPGDYNVCPADRTALQGTHELQPGMIIRNKYEILERIGIGGMGAVYRGRHLTFNELCAIKIVNDAIAGDANFLQRFQTEAVVTRKLRHPNAVRVDDFDYTDDGRPFIVMELVEGKNIGEVLEHEGPLRVPRALRIATQAARALGTAHKLGVVHRDIKPANIILTTDEQGQEIAKVLDFGIAKLREAAGDGQPGMTMTGMVVGTPLYMSPEQFMGKKAAGEIDGRTDIYSLGVVLYQMVTAQLPFDGDTPYSLMMQHMQGTVRPPHELAPDLHIPDSLSRVILKAIDKAREQRFQTAEEFIAAMDEVANQPVTSVLTQPVAENEGAPGGPLGKEDVLKAGSPPSTHAAQVSPNPTGFESPLAHVPTTPSPSAAVPSAPAAAPPSLASTGRNAATTDSVLVKSAAQHLFLQPRRFRFKQFLTLVALILAAVLIAGVGYLKYPSIWRWRIQSTVTERLSHAQSPTLRQAAVRVFVSDAREVILDGKVPSKEDFDAAGYLAASVSGVTHVNNRITFPAVVLEGVPTGAPAETTESLISDGKRFLDEGKYDEAIASLRKAAADPNNKAAQALLERAQRAQKTEEELLRKRQ